MGHSKCQCASLLSFVAFMSLEPQIFGAKPVRASINAWAAIKKDTFTFPELNYPEISRKDKSAISFSGGGARSYSVSLGYLRGLKDLGLLDKPRYIAGISGGNWATAVYAFRQVTTPDNELLGDWQPPGNITLEGLREIPERCARASATKPLWKDIIIALVEGEDLGIVWQNLIWDRYLKPYGIAFNASFAHDFTQIERFYRRNPDVKPGSINAISPNLTRPYPILGISVLGPTDLSPYPLKQREFTFLEVVPLYMGEYNPQRVTYEKECFLHLHCKNKTYPMGGYVETFGFGSPSGHNPDYKPGDDRFDVSFTIPFTVREAVGLSSTAPAAAVASLTPFSQQLLASYNYVSPTDSRLRSSAFVLGDGGDVMNTNVVGLIQRKIKKFLLFCNAEIPLQPRDRYNPFERAPGENDIQDEIPALFGISVHKSDFYDFSKNQVFRTEDYARVASTMQKAQAKGRGIVVTTPLITVQNDWYGIDAGFRCNVTWIYLSRASEWENQLSSEIRELVTPRKNPNDPSSIPTRGPFRRFPHYNTLGQLTLSASQANLLADFGAWLIHANKDVLEKALG